MSSKYKSSGVDLEAGYRSIELIKKHVRRTGASSMIGNFGGVFDLSKHNYNEPVLVSGTDGVGTKLEIAFNYDKHDTVGIDLVAMCVNDILSQGAKPLYFLDYIALGKNVPEKVEQIVKGIADGCVIANCQLIGGETAEMPDIYHNDHYDLAGFCVGCVEKEMLIDGSRIKCGNKLVGISSSGIHSNGFSLVRKILFKDNNYDLNEIYEPFDVPLGEVLLEPTKIYVESIITVLAAYNVKGIVHVTGGGFDENIPRVLNEDLGVVINKDSFNVPTIFEFIKDLGNIDDREMYNIFNMGIGMILFVKEEDTEGVVKLIEDCGESAYVIGEVVNESGVHFI